MLTEPRQRARVRRPARQALFIELLPSARRGPKPRCTVTTLWLLSASDLAHANCLRDQLAIDCFRRHVCVSLSKIGALLKGLGARREGSSAAGSYVVRRRPQTSAQATFANTLCPQNFAHWSNALPHFDPLRRPLRSSGSQSQTSSPRWNRRRNLFTLTKMSRVVPAYPARLLRSNVFS